MGSSCQPAWSLGRGGQPSAGPPSAFPFSFSLAGSDKRTLTLPMPLRRGPGLSLHRIPAPPTWHVPHGGPALPLGPRLAGGSGLALSGHQPLLGRWAGLWSPWDNVPFGKGRFPLHPKPQGPQTALVATGGSLHTCLLCKASPSQPAGQ